jgi:hypothetical protein
MRINEIQLSNTEYKTKIQTELDDLEKEKVRLQAEYAKVANDWFWADKNSPDKTKLNTQMHDLNQQLAHVYATMHKILKQQPPKAGEILKTIEQECSTILGLNKKTQKFLLSGMTDRGAAFSGVTKTNRKPKDSDPELTAKFDDYLRELNFKALRSNSIFVSTDLDQADMYGDIYLIFPKNNQFHYTYTKQKDIVLDKDREQSLSSMSEFIANYSPMAQQLDLAMHKGVEILISGSYIALKGAIFGRWIEKLWGIDYSQQPG